MTPIETNSYSCHHSTPTCQKDKGKIDLGDTVSNTADSTVYMVSHKGDAEYRLCTASYYLLKPCKTFFSSFTTNSDYTQKWNTKALLHLCKLILKILQSLKT